MFYSNGNYEAFIRPRKPQGVDGKSAYLIGGGIASLSAAGFLIRDGGACRSRGARSTTFVRCSTRGP
jgi:myosin-crossreactive antigen